MASETAIHDENGHGTNGERKLLSVAFQVKQKSFFGSVNTFGFRLDKLCKSALFRIYEKRYSKFDIYYMRK